MKHDDYIIVGGELYHYGVLGMKWGVRRASRKQKQNERLKKKALNYDIKSEKLYKKSEKAHAKQDLEAANRAAKKSAKNQVKADTLRKKALKETSEFKKTSLEKKAAKAEYKSATQRMEAERLSKTVGYGAKAMRYSVKSDAMARKAAKTRMKIAANNKFVAKTKQKLRDVPESEIAKGRAYINDFLNATEKR